MTSDLGDIRQALAACAGVPLALQVDGRGGQFATMIGRMARGDTITDAEIKRTMRAAGPQFIRGRGGTKATAIVSVRGIALYDVELQPLAFSTLLLSQTMNTLAQDPEIGTIVLDIDSPGGAVPGTSEAADAVFRARQRKPVVAIVNPLAASAAYWIASQASEIVAVPSADVGSIGVFMSHMDQSSMMRRIGLNATYIYSARYKVEGNPTEPLSDSARSYYQGEVDVIHADFVKAVARGRGVSASTVETNFGQGRTVMAKAAKAAGMVDRVQTLDAAISGLNLTSGRRRSELHNIMAKALANGPENTTLARLRRKEQLLTAKMQNTTDPVERERLRKVRVRTRKLMIYAST